MLVDWMVGWLVGSVGGTFGCVAFVFAQIVISGGARDARACNYVAPFYIAAVAAVVAPS
jgi:hypothetical protein